MKLLRDLIRLTPKHAHTAPDRSAISAARYSFQASYADRPHLPELVTLAETVDQWWHGIEAYVVTGISNAASATGPTNGSDHAAHPPDGPEGADSPSSSMTRVDCLNTREDWPKYLRLTCAAYVRAGGP